MENKTTIELIAEFEKLNLDNDPDGEKYEEVMAELKQRDPFTAIFEPEWHGSLASLQEQVQQLQADIRVLKRHKHDPNNGDVLARI